MKKNISITVVLLIALTALTGCSTEWKEYTNDAGNFTVSFPAVPTEKKETQDMGGGISMSTISHSASPLYGLAGKRFTVVYIDYSSPAGVEFDDIAARQGAKSGIESKGGKVKSDGDVNIAGYDGWQFEVTSNEGDSTVIMFRAESRLYLLEVARKKGKDVSADTKKFFDSFSLNK